MAGESFVQGVVLYLGRATVPFGAAVHRRAPGRPLVTARTAVSAIGSGKVQGKVREVAFSAGPVPVSSAASPGASSCAPGLAGSSVPTRRFRMGALDVTLKHVSPRRLALAAPGSCWG